MRLVRPPGKLVAAFVGILAMMMVSAVPAFAQCPLCRLAIENSTQGGGMGRSLNAGILVLLVPPVTVFCSIFIVAIKSRRAEKLEEDKETLPHL